LEVQGFGVVGGEEDEGVVERVCVSGVGEGKLRKVMYVHLRLVCAGAHEPLAILADTNAATGLLELEILKKFDAVLVLGVILEAALPATGQPVWQRSGSRGAGDGVDRHGAWI
jgi:hypothetical protein